MLLISIVLVRVEKDHDSTANLCHGCCMLNAVFNISLNRINTICVVTVQPNLNPAER